MKLDRRTFIKYLTFGLVSIPAVTLQCGNSKDKDEYSGTIMQFRADERLIEGDYIMLKPTPMGSFITKCDKDYAFCAGMAIENIEKNTVGKVMTSGTKFNHTNNSLEYIGFTL